MGLYGFDLSGIFVRPPLKSPGRKPFMANPKPLAVIGEDFDGGPAFVAKDKHATAQRVCFKLDPAQTGQTVNAASEINRLYGHKYPHMRSNLDHDGFPQNARPSS